MSGSIRNVNHWIVGCVLAGGMEAVNVAPANSCPSWAGKTRACEVCLAPDDSPPVDDDAPKRRERSRHAGHVQSLRSLWRPAATKSAQARWGELLWSTGSRFGSRSLHAGTGLQLSRSLEGLQGALARKHPATE